MTEDKAGYDLFEYRKKLFRDVQSWKKPDRIPLSANVFTWMFLDAGYTVPVATRAYSIIEDCMIQFVKKYKVDSLNVASSGFRNTFLLNDALGAGSGYSDNEDVNLNVELSNYLKIDEFDALIENYTKTIWEKVLFRRYPDAADYTPEQFAEAAKTLLDLNNARERIDKRMRSEFGIVNELTNLPGFNTGFEYLWKYYCGMKEMAINLRRYPEKTKETCYALDEIFLKNGIAGLSATDGPNPNEAYDAFVTMLATTMMSVKQFEELWAPSEEKFIKYAQEHGKQIFFFAEGSWERFGDFFNQFNKGTCCMLVEDDDPYVIRKKFPNICLAGGLHVDKMGHAAPSECIDMAKRAIDELGAEGGLILSPNKMVSYPYDMKSENLAAVADFVNEYRW